MYMEIEILIIILYLLLTLLIGYFSKSKNSSSAKSYLLANRNVGSLLIGGTIFATFWGGGTLMGGAGASFLSYNLGTLADPWASGITLILMALFMTSILLKINIGTLGELYNLRFGKIGSYIASMLSIPTLIAWTTVQLVAIGKLLNLFIKINPIYSIIFAGIIVIIYTYMGGMKAVILTDNIQAIIIILGLLILIPTCIFYISNDVSFQNNNILYGNLKKSIFYIIENTPIDFWSLFPSSDPNHPSGIIWQEGIKGFLKWCSSIFGMGLGSLASLDISQRILCAKNDIVAKKGLLIGTLLYWFAGLGPIFIGLLGILLCRIDLIDNYTLLNDPEIIVPYLAKKLLGPIPLSLFIGSIMAAVMSTSSSTIFASAATITTSIFPGSTKDNIDIIQSQKALKLTKFLVIIIGLFCVILGMVAPNLYNLMIFGFTLLFACLFWVLICGLFWNKANTPGCIASMFTGLITSIFCCIYISYYCHSFIIIPIGMPLWDICFTFIPWIFSGISMFIISLITQNKYPPKLLKY